MCDLTPAFDLSQPTISHHLKVLHESGLLDREKRGVLGLLPGPPEAMERHAVTLLATVGAGRPARERHRPRDAARGPRTPAVLQRLSTLDRFLPVWIVAGHGRSACSWAA